MNILNSHSDTQSNQGFLDCLYFESNNLISHTMKWDDISLKLFLQYNETDDLARERAMYSTVGRQITSEEIQKELQEIRKTADETMDTIWNVLAKREVYLFVEVIEPNTEKKKSMMLLREFDNFTKGLHQDAELTWWPTHFRSLKETSEWATGALKTA